MASPLLLAAICSDGIAFVATHTAQSYEPLLVDCVIDSDDNCNNDEQNDLLLQDLPSSYKGPTRIESIMEHLHTNTNTNTNTNTDEQRGTCNSIGLATAGWRADCISLVDKCRSIVKTQQSRYGIYNQQLNTQQNSAAESAGRSDRETIVDNYEDDEMGYMISNMAYQWLAHCYVSETVRVSFHRF